MHAFAVALVHVLLVLLVATQCPPCKRNAGLLVYGVFRQVACLVVGVVHSDLKPDNILLTDRHPDAASPK